MRALLDAEADALDAATLSRLNRARQAALDAGLQSRRQFWRGAWMLLPASACGLLVWLAPLTLPVTPQAGPSLTELEALLSEPVGVESELLASDAPLELIDEWEFYAWLEQQPDADRS
ncbi:MAG: hypothetical protein MUE46_02095 [Xanthomonadales bacterium]|jgi:hypothetical protein|nr:hypothetical protein [Xanthomonadales bacterium]